MNKLKSRLFFFGVLGIFILAIVIRLAFPFYSLNFDETFSLDLAQKPIHEMWTLTQYETNPPLYYFIVAGWAGLVGDTDFDLRLLSIIAGVVTILGAYALAKMLFGKLSALISALFFAISPFVIFFAREARMYPLMTAAGLWAFVCFWSYRKNRSPWMLVLYLVLLTITGLLHNSALLVLLAHGLFVLFVRSVRPMSKLKWVVIHIPTILICGFFVLRSIISRATFNGTILGHWLFHTQPQTFFFPDVVLSGFFGNLNVFGRGTALIFLVFGLALVYFIFHVSFVNRTVSLNPRDDASPYRFWIGFVALFPLLMGFAFGIYSERVFVLPLAIVIIILGVGCARMPNVYLRYVCVVIICIFSFISLPYIIRINPLVHWDTLAQYLNNNAGQQDLVLINPFHEKITFDRYDTEKKLNVRGFFPEKDTQTFKDIILYNPVPIVDTNSVEDLARQTENFNRVWLVDAIGEKSNLLNSKLVREWFPQNGWRRMQAEIFGAYDSGSVIEYERN